ncbi:MAG TPA: hypothetical protein PLJ40_03995 [Paludibacteraceae bacterium]|jgi:hypothetical protein|nr:hypothetical protein [Paludibacteraceae bacterium]HQB69388.1 hypothetical protein [Paludibacteraceae bacterium]HRS67892.1 hypothetical protein [Paludibacteraceae bacterium]
MKQLFLLLAFFLVSSSALLAESDCKKEKIDCLGECGRMIDEDGDGFCDHGGLSTPETETTNYLLIELISATLVLYGASVLLVKRKCYKKATHRKIWNYILLVTFLVSALLGLWLVILLNYDIETDFYTSYLTWHVDFGIAMSIVGIIHFLWHWNYYFGKK